MPPPPTSPLQSEHPTVLVVDDNEAMVLFCKRILQEAGCSVLSASGSSEALKLCKAHQGSIDLLVADLVLPPPEFSFATSDNEFPHVHGLDLALRALRMRTNLRVILMSGNIENELAGYGIRKDTLPFLPKPFESSTFVALVRETLNAPPPTPESLQKDPSRGPKGADEWFD